MNKIWFSLVSALIAAGSTGAAQLTLVDSVTVDSVWNSDTTDGGANREQRRDVKLSFRPVASDSVVCVVDVSLDSGRTWIYDRDFFDGIGNVGSFKAAPNAKNSIVIRVNCGDTGKIVFRVTAHSDTTTAGLFRFSNQINGWADTTDSYTFFSNAAGLRSQIDGGYTQYYACGLVDGFRQQLVDTVDTVFNQVMVADMGSSLRAEALFTETKSKLPGLDTAVFSALDTSAAAEDILGGITVATHFRCFYIEMNLNGYLQMSDAISDMKKFLSFYR